MYYIVHIIIFTIYFYVPVADSPKSSTSERRRSSDQSSPPPVVYNPQNSSAQPTSNGSTTPTSTTMPVPEFSLSIDGSSRVSPASNAVRNTCRDMVYKAMKKGLNEGKIVHVYKE